ncbi:hypothetical protein KP509_24G076600 [Ceratopteris richardii]|uniref:Terpene cyclase/mutase family member n=1 Tax=Ceratopteris richardii TaxID=49495 RepID=A0A8T2RYF9_CERRI|nr:hypothetical protein KP509_24G076600 [Ceratopteris richardii]KAH7300734.1 hypothetical protein KP509_24G076600 [Ceratopteris richardii]
MDTMATVTLPYNQDYNTEDNVQAGELRKSLEEAMEESRKLLLSIQYPEGYWWAELEGNATVTSQTVLLYKILGIAEQYPFHKVERYLRRMQCAHGGWELYYGDGGCLNCTIESYMALRLLDVSKTDPALQKAKRFILSRGGIDKARMFTKICMALLGCYEWSRLPSLPPWLMLLPSWFPFNIYDTSAWARPILVPLITIIDKKLVVKLSGDLSFDELYTKDRVKNSFVMSLWSDWKSSLFLGIDCFFKGMERLGLVPFRQRGLREATRWFLMRLEETGDFAGVYPGMFYAILCTNKILGVEVAEPILRKQLLGLNKYTVETRDELVVQPTLSPVWDTAFTVRSLVESGMEPDHPALQKAGEWLLKNQVSCQGDWAYKVPSASGCGGWAFQFCNTWYPDVDDTACVVMALNSIEMKDEGEKCSAIGRAVSWIRHLQSTPGGWGAFDKDNDQEWLNSTPVGDLKALIDPNTVDVTARVLEMVGRLMTQSTLMSQCKLIDTCMPPESVVRALTYLKNEQEEEGCWFGRWGVNYIYGTCGALIALALAAPKGSCKDEIRRGAKWLVQMQNKPERMLRDRPAGRGAAHAADGGWGDGGWGETCASYGDPKLKGGCQASTASQTAWALQGLLAAGDALGQYEEDAIHLGIKYLLSTQRRDGSWHEAYFTGTGFPCHFYLRYHMYAQHFPLSALSRYRHRIEDGRIRKPAWY